MQQTTVHSVHLRLTGSKYLKYNFTKGIFAVQNAFFGEDAIPRAIGHCWRSLIAWFPAPICSERYHDSRTCGTCKMKNPLSTLLVLGITRFVSNRKVCYKRLRYPTFRNHISTKNDRNPYPYATGNARPSWQNSPSMTLCAAQAQIEDIRSSFYLSPFSCHSVCCHHGLNPTWTRRDYRGLWLIIAWYSL